MNLLFKTLLAGIVTFMVIVFSLIGTSILINNFGTIGFVVAPFFALAIAFGIVWYWKRFCKKHFKTITPT